MRLSWPCLLACVMASSAFADGEHYPRVYAPAATQVQYRRQQPWSRGIDDVRYHNHNVYVPPAFGHSYSGLPNYAYYGMPYYGGVIGNPYGYGPYGYGGYGYYGAPYHYAAPSPYLYSAPALPPNSVIDGTIQENDARWGQPLPKDLQAKPPAPVARPSSPEAKVRSVRAQVKGDEALREQRFADAYRYYKEAVRAASDQAEPHFRAGFAQLAMRQFESAAKYFKRGLELDPSWPVSGIRLDDVYGEENMLLQSAVTGYATEYAREDIRDPDRLFLVGVLLHFDDQADKAAKLFEAALRLAGEGDHLVAFLRPVQAVEPQAEKAPERDPLLDLLPDAPGAPKQNEEPPPRPDGAQEPPGPALDAPAANAPDAGFDIPLPAE